MLANKISYYAAQVVEGVSRNKRMARKKCCCTVLQLVLI